jgi:hypothetical protein
MDIAEIYKKWDSLPQCKINISPRGEGESLWGRKLPGGRVGIDNNPLAPELRWQDIVDPDVVKAGLPRLIHRRWNTRIWFEYLTRGKTEKGDLPRRKEIYEALKALGNVNFFSSGVGFILLEEADPEIAELTLKKALEPVSRHIVAIDARRD